MSKLVGIVVLAIVATCHCYDNSDMQEIELRPAQEISGPGYTNPNERSDVNAEELSYDFPAVRNSSVQHSAKPPSGQYPVSIPVAKLNKTSRQLPFHPALFLQQQQQQQQALAMAQLNPQLYSGNFMQFGGGLPNINKRQDTENDDDTSDEDEFGSEELSQFNLQRGVFPPGIFSPFGPGFRSGLNEDDLNNTSSTVGEAPGSLNLTVQRRPVFSKLANNATNIKLSPITEVRPPLLSKLASGKPEKDEIQVGSEQVAKRVLPPFFARLGLPSDGDNQPQPIVQNNGYNQPANFGFQSHDGSLTLDSRPPVVPVFGQNEPKVYQVPKISNPILQTSVFSNSGEQHSSGDEGHLSGESTTLTEGRIDMASSDSEPELPDEPPRKHIVRIPGNLGHIVVSTSAPYPQPPEGSSEVFHAYFPANTSMEDTRTNITGSLVEPDSKANKTAEPLQMFNRMPFTDALEHADVIKSVKRRHAAHISEDDEEVSTAKPGKLQLGPGMKIPPKRKPTSAAEDTDSEADSGTSSAAPSIACTNYRNCRCGGSVTKIVTAGAVNVQTNLYPWLVSVNANGQHLCAGNIISSNYVLTAASCVNRHAPKSLQIAAALTSRQPQHLSVSKVLHPPSDEGSKSDRLVLLKIQGNLQPGRHIKFICLPQNATDIEQKRGMLVTFTHDFSTNKLTLLQLPTDRLSAQKCESSPASGKTKFCTSPRKRTCEANVGGSFVVRGKQYSSVLLGVNIGAPGCKKNGNPTTYTYVHPYLDWIIKETANHSTVFCKNPNIKDGCSLSRVLDEETFEEEEEDYSEY